jgi:hypothetical protein
VKLGQPPRAPLGRRHAALPITRLENVTRRRPLHILLQKKTQRGQISKWLWDRKLILRTEACLLNPLHRSENLRAIGLVDLAD